MICRTLAAYNYRYMFDLQKINQGPTRLLVFPHSRKEWRSIGKIRGPKGSRTFYAQHWVCPPIAAKMTWQVAELAAEEFIRQDLEVRFRTKEAIWTKTIRLKEGLSRREFYNRYL